MLLRPGGVDIFYIDESHDTKLFAVTAVTVPFMRLRDGMWRFVWQEHLDGAKAWRLAISKQFKIPTGKELHGVKLAKGRGAYKYGKHQFGPDESVSVYRGVLSAASFLPESSVFTVVGERGPLLYGHERLERVMNALFQRMRRQCVARDVNGMAFFDQGHPEYRSLFRKAQKYLPTGSRYGAQRNLPLDMFVEDANEKDSATCQFTQLADLIAYSAFSKYKVERRLLDDDGSARLGAMYDAFPVRQLNTQVSSGPRDGIVRL